MTNPEIRKQAKLLCKTHGGTLRIISFVSAIMSCAVGIAARLLSRVEDMYILSQIVSFACSVLLYPITTIGVIHAYLGTWRGNTPSFSMLWQFISSKKTYMSALAIGLVYQLVLRAAAIPSYLSLLYVEGYVEGIAIQLAIMIAMIFALACFWLSLRFTLVPYLFGADVPKKTMSYFGKSFRRMKGNIWRLIGMMISTMWWRYYAAVFAVLVIMLVTGLNKSSYDFVYLEMTLLLVSLLMPYPQLALAGFANEMVNRSPDESGQGFIYESGARNIRELRPVRGAVVADLTGIHECYEIENRNGLFVFTANVSAERIMPFVRSFCAKLEEPCFFVLEVPTNKADEQALRHGDNDPLHCDVYYCDGLSRQEIFGLLDEYGELLISDGTSNFGVASHTSKDELFFTRYKIARLYTTDRGRYQDFMLKMDIPFEPEIKTVWENFTHESPGELHAISLGGKDIYSILDELKKRGFYLAERREC